MMDVSSKKQIPYQVVELVRLVNLSLKERFDRIAVLGEIDGFKAYSSGHWYFSLKDAEACISVVVWRTRAAKMGFLPKDGMKVRAVGSVSVYESQGKFQLYAEELVVDGDGEAQRKLEELKQRLSAEGLFAADRKRALPRFPTRVGIVTSLDGAVLRDIMHVASRRGRVHFMVHPCLVQGENAPAQMCVALQRLEGLVDVIILARGGGSSVDLSAFNSEMLARAIFQCHVPVVSAVGHEVDVTIADFVADMRAPTPSAAAECVVPDFAALEADIYGLEQRVFQAGKRTIEDGRQTLHFDVQQAKSLLFRLADKKSQTLAKVVQRLTEFHPRTQLVRHRAYFEQMVAQLSGHRQRMLVDRRQAFLALVDKMHALSPLQVLGRGYAVAFHGAHRVLMQSDAVQEGDAISLRLHRGSLRCEVLEIVE